MRGPSVRLLRRLSAQQRPFLPGKDGYNLSPRKLYVLAVDILVSDKLLVLIMWKTVSTNLSHHESLGLDRDGDGCLSTMDTEMQVLTTCDRDSFLG